MTSTCDSNSFRRRLKCLPAECKPATDLCESLRAPDDNFGLYVWLGFPPPTPGTTMRADLGMLFSDPSGSRTIRRRYLHSAETAIVDDVPSEVRLAPQRWGEVTWS